MRNVNRWKPKGPPPPESILLHSRSCEHLSCRRMRKSPLSLLLLLPLMLLHDDNLNETEGDNGSHYHHTHRYCRDEHLELLWAHLTPARSVHPGLLLSHWHSSHFSLWPTSHSALENLTSCCSLSTYSIRKPAHSERRRNFFWGQSAQCWCSSHMLPWTSFLHSLQKVVHLQKEIKMPLLPTNTRGIAGLPMNVYVIRSNNFHWDLVSQPTSITSVYHFQRKKYSFFGHLRCRRSSVSVGLWQRHPAKLLLWAQTSIQTAPHHFRHRAHLSAQWHSV